jgi:hypothetical protein
LSGPYTVTVAPRLLSESEHKGYLEYLHFTANDGSNLVRWWSVNTGTLAEDFRVLFGEWGPGILENLCAGGDSWQDWRSRERLTYGWVSLQFVGQMTDKNAIPLAKFLNVYPAHRKR